MFRKFVPWMFIILSVISKSVIRIFPATNAHYFLKVRRDWLPMDITTKIRSCETTMSVLRHAIIHSLILYPRIKVHLDTTAFKIDLIRNKITWLTHYINHWEVTRWGNPAQIKRINLYIKVLSMADTKRWNILFILPGSRLFATPRLIGYLLLELPSSDHGGSLKVFLVTYFLKYIFC